MAVSSGDQRSTDTLLLYTDGAARGNPGPAGFGVVLTDPDGRVLEEYGRFIGQATNNEAEYRALIAGLESALLLGEYRIEIFLDSELVVRQILGTYRVKSPTLLPLFGQAQALLNRFDLFSITHIRRALNNRADTLANRAIDLAK
jgi:ribonuclease HI